MRCAACRIPRSFSRSIPRRERVTINMCWASDKNDLVRVIDIFRDKLDHTEASTGRLTQKCFLSPVECDFFFAYASRIPDPEKQIPGAIILYNDRVIPADQVVVVRWWDFTPCKQGLIRSGIFTPRFRATSDQCLDLICERPSKQPRKGSICRVSGVRRQALALAAFLTARGDSRPSRSHGHGTPALRIPGIPKAGAPRGIRKIPMPC
jgi:hypothetical protein